MQNYGRIKKFSHNVDEIDNSQTMMTLLIYCIYIIALSLITFVAYAVDKRKAKKGKWRIKEVTLLGLSFFGGAFGGYVAMNVKRHKTKHWYFHAVNLLGILWQAAALVYLIQNPNWLF